MRLLRDIYIGCWLGFGLWLAYSEFHHRFSLAVFIIFAILWICIAPLPTDPRSGGDSENPGGKS